MKKIILASDQSGQEIPEGTGATLRITFADGRRQTREADLTDQEAMSVADIVNARSVARRGRKPAVA